MNRTTAKWLHIITFILVIVGGLNWLLIGLLNGFNLVTVIFGQWPVLENVIYILVGLSAIYLLATHTTDCKLCSKGKK